MSNQEHYTGSAEHSSEIQDAAHERNAELLKSAENSIESSPEQPHERVEKARHETEAAFAREASSERAGHEPAGTGHAIKQVTDQERALAYRQTMVRIRSEMSAPARAFSKFIHNGGIEKASTALGQSLARPNAVLSGSTSALILVSLVYIAAKIFGYPLSGFETIGAFILGWTIGLIYDYARIMVRGRA